MLFVTGTGRLSELSLQLLQEVVSPRGSHGAEGGSPSSSWSSRSSLLVVLAEHARGGQGRAAGCPQPPVPPVPADPHRIKGCARVSGQEMGEVCGQRTWELVSLKAYE